MKKIALTAALAAWTLTPAAHAGIRTSLEPIIGYERVQILRPDPHSTNRMFYGGRLTVGSNVFALEAEYTRAELEETNTSPTGTTTSVADKAKAGLRGGFALGRLLRMNLRAGAQASKESIDVTTGGSTSRTEVPLSYDPYGGAGFKLMLTPKTSLSAEVVAVFKDFPSMSGNEYQTSAGFAISLP